MKLSSAACRRQLPGVSKNLAASFSVVTSQEQSAKEKPRETSKQCRGQERHK